MSAGMNERCRCGAPADFKCESTKVVEKVRAIRKGGQIIEEQPYVTYFVCARCIRGEITSDTPPRSATPLKHHAAVLRRQEREALAELVGTTEQPRFSDDWGLP